MNKLSNDFAGESNLPRVIFLSVVAALGGFLFGFDSGVINGTVGALKSSFEIGDVEIGFAVASMLLGCAAGAFFAGTLADKFGRKYVLIIAAFAFIVSAWGSIIIIFHRICYIPCFRRAGCWCCKYSFAGLYW